MKLSKDRNDLNIFHILDRYNLADLIEFSKTVRVLYVDNDTDLRYDYYGIFKIFFHDIDIASNGQEGLDFFYQNKYDLIITALDLEQINGVEMLTEIREISRDVTILALSSKEEYFVDLIRLGIDGYILSPVEIEQFVQIMEKVIDTLKSKQSLYEYRTRLENKNLELEHRVKEEVEKNRKKDLQLFEQARISAVGEMLSNIAHQWRQPLSVISTATTSVEIKKEMDTLTDEFLEHSLEKINYNTQYLSSIIDMFSEFIRDDETKKEIVLQELITEILDISKVSFKESHIRIIENYNDKSPLSMKIIPARLSQVILDILNNSRDAIFERDIEKPWVKIDIEKIQNEVTISIEDNAGGISTEIMPKIFDPYFTTKHQALGTGLGLHISYRIVKEALNGELYVKNTQHGAKFFIKIPI